MATVSDARGVPVSLPELPSADASRRHAPRRAESVPRAAAEVTEGDGRRVSRLTVPAFSALLSGGSLLHAQPPSLSQTWARHRRAATHYNAWAMSVPRHAWGALHTALTAVLLALIWAIESPPRLLVAAGLIFACWRFL